MQTKTSRIETQDSITETIQEYIVELKREREELMKLLRTTESQPVIVHVNSKLADINDELDKLSDGDSEIEFNS